VRDEGFAFVDPVDPDTIGTEFDIDVFDVSLAGRINSLSSLIGLMNDAQSFPVEELEADGSIGLSAFVSGTAYDNNLEPQFPLEMVSGLYANVTIEHTEPLTETEDDPSTIISGKLNFSYGTNYGDVPTGETSTVYRMRSVLHIDVLPFSFDLQDEDFQTFWGEIAETGPQDDEDWITLADFIWGEGHEDDCVSITWLLSGEGTDEDQTMVIEGIEALQLLFAFIEGAMGSEV
jgi:hypothetical protein